jgi:hypothetical protein
MLALRPEDAVRALRALPDGAGPSAFLSQLRKHGITPPAGSPSIPSRRRDKTA